MAGKRAVLIMDLVMSKVMKKLGKLDRSWQKQKRSILSVKNAIGAVFMGAAVRKMISVGGDLIQSAKEQADAEMSLEAAMRSRGTYTKDALADLKEYASELQRTTTIGDETTLKIMGMLQAFGLSNEEIKRGVRIAADFNARGEDMKAIAKVIGRARVGDIGMLTRYNIKLTEAEKKAKDFNVVLDKMEDLHRGAARALADTPVGKLQQMANAWGDIKESVGFGLADALTNIAKNIGLSADELGRFNDKAGELASIKISSALQDLAAGFTGLWGVLKKIGAVAMINPLTQVSELVQGKALFSTATGMWESGNRSLASARGQVAGIDAREAMAIGAMGNLSAAQIKANREKVMRERERRNKASIGTVR